MMVAVSLVLLLTVLEHANGIKTDHDPEIIEHPKDEYIGKSAYAVIRCQAKYASGLDFKCNDDWLTNHKTRDIKHWKDDNGVEHVSGSIKIKKEKVEAHLGEKDYYCNCVAGNSKGVLAHSKNADIRIAYFKTEFSEEPYDKNEQVGQSVELVCVPPDGLPAPKISWLKDGNLIPTDGTNTLINYNGNLIIRAARLQDSGEYVCMAQNMIDTRRSRPAKLDVYTDGAWGSWDAWSGCPISQNKCIKESTFRKRSCDSPPPQGQSGKDCVGNDKQEKECSTSCNIDGGWSNWQEWTVCSASCSQIRARKCNHPEPQNDGKKCSGPETEQIDCSSDFCKRNETFMDSLSDQPALIAGLAVVTVLFLSALAVGMIVFRKVRKNKAKHNTPRPCQTSRCSDLYDRYIPGYISTSASSAGDSSGQHHNRTNTIIEHQLIDYENNQIEKKIIASKGAELQFFGVTVNIPPDALGSDQTISLRVCGGDGPLLPPHQVLLSPVVIVGPNTVQFKKPIILAIPHCINYNLEPINPAVIKNNLSNERITPDNFYGWEIEVKPPGPQLKLQRMKRNQPSSNFLLSSSKPGAWALVGSPKVSNNLNLQFSSKSIGILVYGASITESDFQIRIRVCDYLQSTMTMIDNAELKQPNVIKLCEKQVIGVARSTSGLRIKLDVNASCDWRCTMVTTSQEVSVSQLWRRAAAPVCFDLRKVGMSNFLQLNLILVQGHMATPHYMPINHQIQS